MTETSAAMNYGQSGNGLMRAFVFLVPVALATLPQPAFAASYFGVDTYWKLNVTDSLWRNTGYLEHKGDWYFQDSHGEGHGDIRSGYPGYDLGGTASSSRDSPDFDESGMEYSYIHEWDRSIYEHWFFNNGEESLTVDILLDYSVAALAAVDNPSPGDFANAWAGLSLSFYGSTGGCAGVPRFTDYVASVQTQAGRASKNLSGSQLFQLHLDPGATCWMTIDKDHEGTALAHVAIPADMPATVPVPASALLLGSALAGLGALGRRRRRA